MREAARDYRMDARLSKEYIVWEPRSTREIGNYNF